jgi:hypothetical protein
MVDLACLVVLGVCTWCLANEGVWTAGVTFVCVVLSGLLAMNFFEPLALLLEGFLPPDHANKADMIALGGIFIAAQFALRIAAEKMVPTFVPVPNLLEAGGRWVFAAASGYVVMAFLLTAVHTSTLPREFLDFRPERKMVFGLAPDRQWLGFTQRVSEHALARYLFRNSSGEYIANVFDGPYVQVGDKSSPYSNTVWPSFPIRYAQRRELGSSGGGAAVVVPVAPPQPTNATPSQGGGF